jgi:hypothetical protein
VLLLELLDAVVDVLCVDVGSVVVVGVAVMIGGSLPPPLLLELVAFVPPVWELVAAMPPAWDWIGVGIKPPPPTTPGLPPPLLLLELVALVPPDCELMAEAEAAVVAVGTGFAAVTGEAGSGCFPGCLVSPCGFFSAGFSWACGCFSARFISRASTAVLCSAVVARMAAPSAQAADVVKSLRSFIDVLLGVPGRGAIRRH